MLWTGAVSYFCFSRPLPPALIANAGAWGPRLHTERIIVPESRQQHRQYRGFDPASKPLPDLAVGAIGFKNLEIALQRACVTAGKEKQLTPVSCPNSIRATFVQDHFAFQATSVLRGRTVLLLGQNRR